jgi:hypothetical protein
MNCAVRFVSGQKSHRKLQAFVISMYTFLYFFIPVAPVLVNDVIYIAYHTIKNTTIYTLEQEPHLQLKEKPSASTSERLNYT